MPDYTNKIYKVNIDGTDYDIIDQGARDLIDALGDAVYWIGVTTTALTDGATTNPITVGGESITAKVGGMAQYSGEEFVYNGTAWQSIGKNNFGDFAFVNTGDVTGTAAAQTFTGTQATIESTLGGGTAENVVESIGSDTTAKIKEFDEAGSVTAGSAAAFTQGTDQWSASVNNGVLSFSFTQGQDSFTPNAPTQVTLPTSKETDVVTASGTATTKQITIPTTGSATYTPEGTNGTSSVTGTATPHTA